VSATGSVTVTVPTTTTPGDYWLITCAADTRLGTETDETNNGLASARRVTVTP
jgi:hypothetical protein